MMEVGIHSINFEAREHLVNFVQEGVDKLERFYENIQKAEVFLKLKADPALNKEVGIRIHVPGTELYASKTCETFEEATDEVLEALIRQLKKYKARQVS
ncbi:ribosomal subunit interface protein [Bacteroides coprosuis DSM 18011]|uniref:Ribosomal subunit interface protein n=2 Tax=Bacteroides TaxID=816 RepID=F3ZRK3_9BACE|nr:ribosomal subunit interface protein [Bacteroides coprosuis DSM 18011]